MDGDLVGAAEAISKAMQGQFGMFGRLGIEIEATGDKFKDLEALLKKVATLGEGQLAAAQKTMAGGFKTLGNAVGDFFEGIGGLIAKTQLVQAATYGFATSVDWLAKKITPAVPQIAGLKNVVGQAGKSLAEARDGAKEFADKLGEIRTEAEAIAKALDAALKAKKALFDEHNERDDAAEELAIAQIDRDVAAKKLSEPDARFRRAGVKQFYAGRRHSRQQELLQSEIESIDEQDRAAEGEISEVTRSIANAQATTQNATALEAKRRRANELKAEMQAAMAEEERNALGWVYGQGGAPDDLMAARVEGKRRRYFAAATELSGLAAGMPRNVPFTTTAQAREEAITAAGIPRIAELTAGRADLAARRDALQMQAQTGNIRFNLGRDTTITQLEAAGLNDLNQHRQQFAQTILQNARGGGGQAAEVAAMEKLGKTILTDRGELTKRIERIEQELRYHKGNIGDLRNQ